MMKAIVNANLILEDGILFDATLLLKDGVILDYGPADRVEIPQGSQVLDAGGKYVGPGFVDIHCHAGAGVRFEEEPEKAADHCLTHGTTTVLATLGHDVPYEEMAATIGRVGAMIDAGSNIGGIYMEGPFMNPKYGGAPEKNKWLGAIDMEKAADVVSMLGSSLRVWAVAPEREGVPEFVKMVHAKNPNVKFAFGHSQATPAQIFALKNQGMTIQTHTTNATATLPAPAGTRNCGPDEACLYDPDIYAEVICDSQGIHVHPDMLRLVYRIKGPDKVILITDCTAFREEAPEELRSCPDLNFDRDGNLCGSLLTMDWACRNMMTHTSAGLCQVFRMASYNPARAVGLLDTVGSIAPGKRANLVLTDDRVNIYAVMLDGNIVKGNF